jgi:PBP superfamily domain
VSANKKGVILARVVGKIVALAQPSACLTLPVSSGIRMNTAGSQARISTRLLDDEIDGTLIVAGCDPAVALLIAWMARTGSRINAVALPCSSGRAPAALADGSVLAGYEDEVTGHLEVAAAVQNGDADVGVTIRVAAEAYGLGFIPLREERYDLAIPETELESAPVSRMLDALNSRRFAR